MLEWFKQEEYEELDLVAFLLGKGALEFHISNPGVIGGIQRCPLCCHG